MTSTDTKTSKKYAVYKIMTTTQQPIIIYLSGSPEISSVAGFAQYMKKKGVTDVFCFCDPEYDYKYILSADISYNKMSFSDGTSPPALVINSFNQKLDNLIVQNRNKTITGEHPSQSHSPIIINMHCQTGLGRAPTIITYLMISRCNIEKTTAVSNVRKLRRGALNRDQLDWIFSGNIKKTKKTHLVCIIM